MGRTVITSKEPSKLALVKVTNVTGYVETKDNIVWKFKTEEDAIKAANDFMNAGFEYVRREI